MLEIAFLVKRYGNIVALDGRSLRVPAGHLIGLLGPNCAGSPLPNRGFHRVR